MVSTGKFLKWGNFKTVETRISVSPWLCKGGFVLFEVAVLLLLAVIAVRETVRRGQPEAALS